MEKEEMDNKIFDSQRQYVDVQDNIKMDLIPLNVEFLPYLKEAPSR